MPKVSVIIPVFNGEAYLRQCLDSVCAQTLEEIEIICVDDGSTDASWRILEEYGKRDKRFRLIRQENQHVAAARNNGFAQAEGKYVIFWDCDDFFEPSALELLYQRAEETEAEICVCGSDSYDQQTGKIHPENGSLNLKRIPEGDTFNRLTNPEHIWSFTNLPVWNKLFLRSFLSTNHLTFPSFRYGEDRNFLFIALCQASRIAAVNAVLIHYRGNNPESLGGKIPLSATESLRALELVSDELIRRDIVPTEIMGRDMLQIALFTLRLSKTEEEFFRVLESMRGGDNSLLERCDIVDKEPGYYGGVNNDEYVRRMLYDKPGDVLAFFMNDIWMKGRRVKSSQVRLKAELKAVKAELRRIKGDFDAMRNSRSYRLGRMLLFIPRKIRDLFRRSA